MDPILACLARLNCTNPVRERIRVSAKESPEDKDDLDDCRLPMSCIFSTQQYGG